MSLRSFFRRLRGLSQVSPYAKISASRAALALLDVVDLPVCNLSLIDGKRLSKLVTYYMDSTADAVSLAVWLKLRGIAEPQCTATTVTLTLRDVYKALIMNEPHMTETVRRKHLSGVYGLRKQTVKPAAPSVASAPPVVPRISLDAAYLTMAHTLARRSKAVRLQVGAFIVKDTQIISDGYNGMPYGAAQDVCETSDGNVLTTRPEVLHAESNALMKLSRYGGTGAEGATMYVTHSPCVECAKLIIQARIKRVVFAEQYRSDAGSILLGEYGIQVEQLNLEAK